MIAVGEGTIVDGRYKVSERLGAGGMAEVYCALDLQLGRQVALKMLYPRFAEDSEFVERFRREASSAAGLQHQHVVSVYDRGEWEGMPYIAMEHVDGRTLKALIVAEAPLDPRRAIDLTVQVLRAARFAHKRGVIHRDLKPHNVMVDDEDRAKVMDFGIAKAGASDMTQTGSIMGTAQYLSPEQAQGLDTDAPSDLYSVGILLYELLCGRVPFEGDSAVSIALKQVSEAPLPPSALNPAVTPDLEAVVLHALEKDPRHRFADADGFIAALQAVRRNLDAGATSQAPIAFPPTSEADALAADGAAVPYPMPDGPLGPPPPPDPDARRRRWWWAVIALLAVAALVAGGLLLFGGSQVTVPGVTGKPKADAEAVLRASGFSTVEVLRTSDRAADTVLAQQPGPGAKVDQGASIRLTISAGPGEAAIPDVADQGAAAAARRLRSAGFRSRQRRRSSADVTAGRVIGTLPVAGTSLTKGSVVTLVVSSGPRLVAVPGVTGQDSADARSALVAAGFRVATTSEETTDSDPGTVLAQDPEGGRAPEGSTVTLTVAKRPSLVDVPDVTGATQDAATTTLSGAGFRVVVKTVASTSADQDGVVLDQSPGGGQAKPGSTVTISVAQAVDGTSTTPTSTTTTTPPAATGTVGR